VTWPVVGSISPLIIRASVDFPLLPEKLSVGDEGQCVARKGTSANGRMSGEVR